MILTPSVSWFSLILITTRLRPCYPQQWASVYSAVSPSPSRTLSIRSPRIQTSTTLYSSPMYLRNSLCNPTAPCTHLTYYSKNKRRPSHFTVNYTTISEHGLYTPTAQTGCPFSKSWLSSHVYCAAK